MNQTIILLFSILLISCGTRKVAIQEIKKDSLSQIYTKIVTNEVSNLSSKNNIIVDEFIITPLDSCKDIVVNGVTYRNAILSYKKTKDNSLRTEQKIVSKIEDKQQIVKTSYKENKKDIERKSFPYWLLLIPVVLYLIYKYLCFLYPPLKIFL